MRARGQNSAALPVARSSNRMPSAMQQIALLEHQIGRARGVHAHHPEKERMTRRHDAETEERRRDRDRARLRESAHQVRRAGGDDARADEQHRPPRRLEHRDRAPRVVRGAGDRGGGASRLGPRVDGDGLELHVLRDVDHDRSGTVGGRDAKRLGHDVQQLARRRHQVVVLGDRDGETVGVDLLKRVGADHRARHLAGDRDERDRVELGVGDRRQEIGRARARGPETDRRRPRAARHPLGDEPGTLLVTREHVMDRAAVKRVVERQASAARDAGDRGDPLAFEELHDEPRAVRLHVVLLPRSACGSGNGGGPKRRNPRRPRAGRGFGCVTLASPLRRDGLGHTDDDDNDDRLAGVGSRSVDEAGGEHVGLSLARRQGARQGGTRRGGLPAGRDRGRPHAGNRFDIAV